MNFTVLLTGPEIAMIPSIVRNTHRDRLDIEYVL